MAYSHGETRQALFPMRLPGEAKRPIHDLLVIYTRALVLPRKVVACIFGGSEFAK